MLNSFSLYLATYSLTSTSETVYGIWNPTAGGNSIPATVGWGAGNSPPGEEARNMLDSNSSTKYLNFGSCSLTATPSLDCGLNTGVYFTLSRGASVLRSLRFRTANDAPERDPLMVTVEGSNQTSALTQGSSWTLIYNGSTGLYTNPGRFQLGITQYINNFISYESYRLLVVSIRNPAIATQYAEVEFNGY